MDHSLAQGKAGNPAENYDSEEDDDYLPSDAESGDEELDATAVVAEEDGSVRKASGTAKRSEKKAKSKKKDYGVGSDSVAQAEDDELANILSRPKRRCARGSLGESVVVVESSEVKALEKEGDAAKKKKIDDLWASLQQKGSITKTKVSASASSSKQGDSIRTSKPAESKLVKVAEVLDFAGEKISVERTVVSGSKEEKKLVEALKNEQKREELMKKPSNNLDDILADIGKKKKMNTLEKSRMDWTQYKETTKISDELKHATKTGYLDKMAFLQRVDSRVKDNLKTLRQSKPS